MKVVESLRFEDAHLSGRALRQRVARTLRHGRRLCRIVSHVETPIVEGGEVLFREHRVDVIVSIPAKDGRIYRGANK